MKHLRFYVLSKMIVMYPIIALPFSSCFIKTLGKKQAAQPGS